MDGQKKLRTLLSYNIFGNLALYVLEKPRIETLARFASRSFYGRCLSDLGCGDGSNSLRIAKALKAKTLVGYEFNKHLIARARRRGLEVEEMDLNIQVPHGDLAIIWGVAHHLAQPEAFLTKIRDNFSAAVFKEPVRTFWSFTDGGFPKPEDEWRKLFNEIFGKCSFYRRGHELYVFWEKGSLSSNNTAYPIDYSNR